MDLLTTARVVISLAVVLGVIWFLSRRFRGGAAVAQRKQSRVSVLGKTGIGPKASVVVIETEGMRLVLGVTEHGMSVLHSADAPAEAFATAMDAASAASAPAREPAPAPAPSPRSQIRRVSAADSHRIRDLGADAAALAPQFRDRRAIFYSSLLTNVKALISK